MAYPHKQSGWMRRFMRWFFGAPFEELPPEFGDSVPAELHVFAAEAEEVQHHATGKVPMQTLGHHPQTKPIQQDTSLERE